MKKKIRRSLIDLVGFLGDPPIDMEIFREVLQRFPEGDEIILKAMRGEISKEEAQRLLSADDRHQRMVEAYLELVRQKQTKT